MTASSPASPRRCARLQREEGSDFARLNRWLHPSIADAAARLAEEPR